MSAPGQAPAVLLVDDDGDFLEVARRILGYAGLGFRVDVVESGTAALDFLERRPPFVAARTPDFIVLDFRLPDINAPAVLRHIRESDALRIIPVLVVSQANWEADQVAALEAGAQAFRVKPSHVQPLRQIFRQFWEGHGSAA